MTSFTASPSTITDGDTLRFTWTAPCGFVSIAQAGQTPFTTLQPSNGSYQLKPSAPGYPTATDVATAYEAKNGDTATPLRATVTMKPSRPPTVSVSASPSSCHPQKWNSQSCTVTCVANASSPAGSALSYQWSGCASGTGSTGTCSFSQPGNSGACTITVTDGRGGSATDSRTVQSTNVAPDVALAGATPWICSGAAYASPQHDQECALLLNVTDDDPDPSHGTTVSVAVANLGCTLYGTGFKTSNVAYADLGIGSLDRHECWVYVTITDDWGLNTVRSLRSPIQ